MFISEIQDQFLKALPPNEGEISEWIHPEKGPRGETLKTHFWLRRGDPRRLILSLSGTHGVEAFIGSRIQAELLRHRELWRNDNPPTVLFIHNLNPFGSAWCRRTNAQNVDLNRNSWIELPRNPMFDRERPWLSSQTGFEFWLGFTRRLSGLFTRSLGEIGSVIARGQSEHPDLIFHTGRARSPELQNLRDFLQRQFPQAPQDLMVLDIHTGLGPWAHESLITDPPVSDELDRRLTELFGKKPIAPGKKNGFHPVFGSLGHLFTQVFPQTHVCHITHEFGTFAAIFVLKNLVLENSTWHQKGPRTVGRNEILLKMFYPENRAWQDTVLGLGIRRFQQIYGLI